MALLSQPSLPSVPSPFCGSALEPRAEDDTGPFCSGEKPPEATSEPAPTNGQPPHHRPVRILIVDDNPDVRDMLSCMVRRLGYAVATAATGLEALAYLRAQRTDIMLLDLAMPDMDGFAVCREVQRDAALPPLYIIITSARDPSEEKATCFALGAADYLTKPFKVRELHARLQVGEQQVRQHQSA